MVCLLESFYVASPFSTVPAFRRVPCFLHFYTAHLSLVPHSPTQESILHLISSRFLTEPIAMSALLRRTSDGTLWRCIFWAKSSLYNCRELQ